MEERKYDKLVGLVATIILVVLLNIEIGDKRILETWVSSVPDANPKDVAKNVSYGILFLGWILRQHIGYFLLTNFKKN